MLKILVVDDEKIIRKGLIKIITALGEDFQVTGEASNGVEALEMVESENPHIVITDIKMPKMDGIELVKNLEKRFPKVRKVVLSGFDEFNYVRDTMKNGAMDYLLKPIDVGQLTGLLGKIAADIKTENERNLNVLNLKIKLNESLPLLKEQFIYELICEGKYSSPEEVEKKLQYYNLRISEGLYHILIVSMDNYRYLYEELGSEQSKINAFIVRNIAEESVSRFTSFFSFMDDAGLVIACSSPETGKGLIDRVAGEISDNLKKYTGLRFTISLGKPVDSLTKLKESYDSSVKALSGRFYMEDSKVIRYDEGKKPYHKNSLEGLAEKFEIQLKNCADMASEKQIPAVMDEFCSKLKEMNVEPEEAVKAFGDTFAKLQLENTKFKEAVVESYGSNYSFSKSLDLFDTLDEIKKYACAVYTEVICKMQAMFSRKDKKLIEVVKDHITRHYSEDITLNKVAELVYVNPNYLSEIFKAQTGESFVDYFTRVRIEKAKELLKDIRVKTYEVGALVGYDDPPYFSKVFKKVVGVSPTEYRNLVR